MSAEGDGQALEAEGNGQALEHVIREVPLAGAEGAVADAIRGLREDGGVRVVAVNMMYKADHVQVTVIAEGPSQQAVEEAMAKYFPAVVGDGDGPPSQKQEGVDSPYFVRSPSL